MVASGWNLLLLALGTLIATTIAQVPDSDRNQDSSTTAEHLSLEQWWPTKQFADQSQFAGTQACAGCHAGVVRTQATTQMALTMMPAANSSILASHTGGIFSFGSYRYEVARSAGSFRLKISDGKEEATEPLQWAFGSGAIAQSYVWWQKGELIESRFNYFVTLRGFDRTPGRLQGTPLSLDMAQGRKIAEFEGRKCYACHSTALTRSGPLAAAQFHPGVTCEGCHGPGRDHIALIKTATSDGPHIVNPARLIPVKAVDFCGACHGTSKDVELGGMVGKITVRFPAYRLEKSRCWGLKGDARLTCFACHNPHLPLERQAAGYDAACLRCHSTGPAGSARGPGQQAACPVATSGCTKCHMTKLTVPGMHYEFTDHKIQIVNANAPFTD